MMTRTKRYEELVSTFKGILPPEQTRFFSNETRLSTVLGLIDKWASSNVKVVDLASGPFVLDFYLEDRDYKSIIAIDSNPRLEEVHSKLKQKKLLTHTLFIPQDITKGAFLQQISYADLIVLNDALAFFYPSHSLWELLPTIRDTLKPGGIFVFDIWSLEFYRAFIWIYNLLYPRYKYFKRYRVSEVVAKLNES